jgi:hypothetical protein
MLAEHVPQTGYLQHICWKVYTCEVYIRCEVRNNGMASEMPSSVQAAHVIWKRYEQCLCLSTRQSLWVRGDSFLYLLSEIVGRAGRTSPVVWADQGWRRRPPSSYSHGCQGKKPLAPTDDLHYDESYNAGTITSRRALPVQLARCILWWTKLLTAVKYRNKFC